MASLAVSIGRSRRERLEIWTACALGLHSLLLILALWIPETQRPLPPPGEPPPELVEIAYVESAQNAEGEPGGGSLDPEPTAPLAAGVTQPSNETRLRPVVTEPDPPEPEPVAPPARVTNDPDAVNDEQAPPDSYEVLAAPLDQLAAFSVADNARAERVSLIKPRAPSEPATGAATHASRGQHLGYGPGAHGGPGGAGRGFRKRGPRGPRGGATGVVNPFGGAHGAWRGEVCFLPPDTEQLKGVKQCPRAGELFTDVINVKPRRFDAGFPGITRRNEWFAIKYTGNFTVRETGAYRFRVLADDGAILTIDGVRLVDNDGIHEPLSKRGRIELSRGVHEFRLTYFQGPRYDIALQVFVKPPKGRERLFRPVI